MSKTRVLFVCLGNICRSPQAEALFNHKLRERGLEDAYEVDSCGTGGYHVGEPPDPRTRAEMQRRGVPMRHAARQLEAADLSRFDILLCMDRQNLRNTRRLAARPEQKQRLHLMREFEPGEDPGDPPDVPDPYFGGEQGFREVTDILERSCEGLLEHLESQRRAAQAG